MPIEALKQLKWSVAAMVETICKPGTAEKEVARCAAEGIQRRIDWIAANLEANNEGKKNVGLEKY